MKTDNPACATEYEDEIECPVCLGFGLLETEDGTVECDECDGNGSVAP